VTAEAFTAWNAFLNVFEGGLSMARTDPGNWTGGAVGKGKLAGSNGGISAASYPSLDIAHLTPVQIEAIRERDFWDKIQADALPGPVAFMVADAAFMSGHDRAIRQMQDVLRVAVDGDLGEQTLDAARATVAQTFVTEFAAVRLLFLISLPIWPIERDGWTRRVICAVPAALATANTDQWNTKPLA
jgi:lysozyme family protein